MNRFYAAKRLKPLGLIFFFPLLISFSSLGAQTVTGAAGLADPLENLEGSARDIGLGSAFVGVADDTSSLYFNPAGLSGLKAPDIELNHNSYLAGTFQEILSTGFPAGDLGGLAFSLDYVNWGTLDLRDVFGNSQGNYNDSDVGFTAGWGREWFQGFSAGLALRVLQDKVVYNLYTSLAADIGILWQPASGWRLGISYLNLGTSVEGSSLSGDLKAGVSCLLTLNPRFTLLTALSGDWTPGSVGNAQAGLEGTMNHQWTLRAGYQMPFYNNQIDGLTGLTAGAGMKINAFTLDYAYLFFGTLGSSQRISLDYQFDLPKEVVEVPVQMPVTVIQKVPEATQPSKDVEVHFKINSDPLSQGQYLEKQGKLQDAIQLYIDGLKDNPKDVLLWQALANLYYRNGNKVNAVECFQMVIQLRPDDQALKDWLVRYKAVTDSK